MKSFYPQEYCGGNISTLKVYVISVTDVYYNCNRYCNGHILFVIFSQFKTLSYVFFDNDNSWGHNFRIKTKNWLKNYK